MNTFFRSLAGVFDSLDREIIFRLESLVVSPVSAEFSGLFMAFRRRLSIKSLKPCLTSTKVVPVKVSVERNESTDRPEDPSTFPDHPDVCLAHVITDVEHHRLL